MKIQWKKVCVVPDSGQPLVVLYSQMVISINK